MMDSFSTGAVLIGVAVGTITTLYLVKKFMAGGVCHCKTKLEDKTVIITGCNTGIGKETAKDMIIRGARVIMACRNMDKTQAAAEDIKNETGCGDRLVVMQLDLSDLASVRTFASTIIKNEKVLHILINNAGVMWTAYSKTKDGFEMQMGTNHFGHFLLTNLLLDLLKKSSPSRIINVSSLAHKWGRINFDDINCEKSYSRHQAYSDSKLANVLFTRELAKKLEGSGVTAHSVHPGAVATELGRHLFNMFPWKNHKWLFNFANKLGGFLVLKSPSQGAQTTIHCAVAAECGKLSGLHYSDCAAKEPCARAKSTEVATKLWQLSEKMVDRN